MYDFSNCSLDELRQLRNQIDSLINQLENPDAKMAHTIKFVVGEKTVSTVSYYNVAYINKARALKGEWLNGKWVFKKEIAEHVEKALLDCYSVNGHAAYPVCTLLIENYDMHANQEGVELFGRPIAKAYGRDGGAKISDDVFFISGRATSGGSVKNWRTSVIDATFEIHNFPIAALERSDVKAAIEAGWCTIK